MGKIKLLALIGGLVALSTAVLLGWWLATGKSEPSEQLQIGLRLARKGDYVTAAKLAASIEENKLKKRVDSSTRYFLIGAAARQTADSLQYRPSRTEKNEEAVEHLQKSRDLRFPPGYEGLGNYLLGLALYDLFRWDEAVEPLEIASERWPKGRNDAVECLIDIELYGSDPNPAAAQQQLDRWMALSALTPNDRDRIAVKRMEILCEQGEHGKVEPVWSTVSNESPYRSNANLVFARCLRKQSQNGDTAQREAQRAQALANIKEIEFLRNVSNDIRRRSMLEQGLIYRDSGLLQQAVSTLSSLRLSSPFEPEFMIAGIEEIDTLIDLKFYAETSATLGQLTKNFTDPKWYNSHWMPVEDMRLRLLASANRMIEQEYYAEADRFVANLPNVCTEVDKLRLDVAIQDRWARKLQKERKAKLASGSIIAPTKEESDAERIEKIFRRAATSIERLCQLDMRSPEYMELLWRGIEDFHYANDFAGSNRLIDRYLDLAPRADHARPLLMRAKNLAAAGKPEDALKTIDKLLLTAPDSPLLPDAKLTAAKLHWGLGNFDKAEALIIDNLYAGNLRPDSPIWKESLIELGTLMFRQGEQMQVRILGAALESGNTGPELLPDMEKSYQQLLRSIASMEEGLRRFHHDSRRYQLLYMTAKAYRMASYWPETLLEGNRLVSEEAIAQWKQKRKELLIQSRDTFATLRREISNEEGGGVIPNAEILLCNSYFGEADLLFQEGNFKGALEAYRAAANRFINEPESLEAFVQMARCQEEMGQLTEVRRTLEMAADILNRIPSDRDERFVKNTRQSRDGWERQIRWMIEETDRRMIR